MTQSTEITTTTPNAIAANQPPESALKNLWQHARMLADSDIIPAAYQRKPNNCVIAIELASRLGSSPLLVMQSLDIIQGKPSWSSKFLIATVNHCGRFSPIRYRFSGRPNTDDYSCVAYATEKDTGEVLEGPMVSIGMAKAEGWATRSGSKWKTMPQLMLMYRSAAFWSRVYCPEVSMGLHTSDEIEDTFEKGSALRDAMADAPTTIAVIPTIGSANAAPAPIPEAEFEEEKPQPTATREPGDET